MQTDVVRSFVSAYSLMYAEKISTGSTAPMLFVSFGRALTGCRRCMYAVRHTGDVDLIPKPQNGSC